MSIFVGVLMFIIRLNFKNSVTFVATILACLRSNRVCLFFIVFFGVGGIVVPLK